MGLFKKIISKGKELFVEDVDDEEKLEVTREFTKELKIERKTKDEELELTMEEKELYKSPSTFKFPVIFEDEDMKPIVEEKKAYTFDRTKPKVKEKEEEVKFTASPIISPIYGILDKNYKKDQITNKTDHPDYISQRNHKINVDIIRQKAFGTLEEDLENSIMEDKGFIYGLKDEELAPEKEDPIADEMGLNGEEPQEEVTLEEAYENYTDYGVEYQSTTVVEEKEEPLQKTEVLSDELFGLIESMHKKETEEEEDN